MKLALVVAAFALILPGRGLAQGGAPIPAVPPPLPPPPAAAAAIPSVATMDAAVAHVQGMRAQGRSNADIARVVSGIVDQRLTNVNSTEGLSREFFYLNPLTYVPLAGIPTQATGIDHRRRVERWDREREGFGARVRSRQDGQDYLHRARWAWDLRAGACAEAAAMTYAILSQAGVPARMMESSASVNGHIFTVIGLGPGYDPARDGSDPNRWGKDAYVVDGWLGRGLTPAEALANPYIRDRSGDVTRREDNPVLQRGWAQMAGKGRLVVTVLDAVSGAMLDGIRVDASGADGTQTRTTAGGQALFDLAIGGRDVVAIPKADSGYKSAKERAAVAEREDTALTLRLTTAPMAILSPLNGTQVADRSVVVTGVIDSDTATSVVVSINGAELQVPVARKQFSIEVPLSPGPNTIWAQAKAARAPSITVVRTSADVGNRRPLAGSGTWSSQLGYSGALRAMLDRVAGTFVVDYAGARQTSSISGRASGSFTASGAGGVIAGALQFAESTPGEAPTGAGGTIEGTLTGATLSGTFRTESDSGTFEATVQ